LPHPTLVVSARLRFPTFLVDGVVAGRWKLDRGRVRIEPFGRLTRVARQEVAEEAERLTAFHA